MRTQHFLFALLTALCLVTGWAQPFDADIRQTADYKQAQTWVPVLLRDNAAATRTNVGLGASNDVTHNKLHLGYFDGGQFKDNFQYTLTLGQTNSGFAKDFAGGISTASDDWSFYAGGKRIWGAMWRYQGNTTNQEKYFDAPVLASDNITGREVFLQPLIVFGGTSIFPSINISSGDLAETNRTISIIGTNYFNGVTNGNAIFTPILFFKNGDSNIASLTRSNFAFSVPISFNSTSLANQSRTNLGFGGGITTNRTFVANGVTNSVTISNGIITGWTQ